MIWFALGVLGFIAHPIQTVKEIFESWHAEQHAPAAPVIIIKHPDRLSEEEVQRIREGFLANYRKYGARPTDGH